MKAEKRVYGVPFYKVNIDFLNNKDICIGYLSIRSKTPEPIKTIGKFYYFTDIDNETYKCTDFKNFGEAILEEQSKLHRPKGRSF